MRIYRISRNTGGNITVQSSDFWSHEFYLEEVYNNIKNGKFSLSQEEIPMVQKSLKMLNAIFIEDGHHRIIERILKGQQLFNVYWDENDPYIDDAHGELPTDRVNLIQFLQQKHFLFFR